MADLFEFPKDRQDRRSITVFLTPHPEDTEATVKKMGDRFGMSAKPRDAGARHVFRDRGASLELFRASDSFRWSTLHRLKAEEQNAAGDLDDAAALDAAAAYLKQRGVRLEGAAKPHITRAELSTLAGGQEKPTTRTVAVHVNYRHELDGLPIFGPGAKTRVTLGAKGRVLEAYQFWRNASKEGERPLISMQGIEDILRRDNAYGELKGEGSRVTIHSMELGYYALPPREYQGMLIPVVAVAGTVSTRVLPRYDFVRYVVATEFKAGEAKESGITTSELPRIIN